MNRPEHRLRDDSYDELLEYYLELERQSWWQQEIDDEESD